MRPSATKPRLLCCSSLGSSVHAAIQRQRPSSINLVSERQSSCSSFNSDSLGLRQRSCSSFSDKTSDSVTTATMCQPFGSVPAATSTAQQDLICNDCAVHTSTASENQQQLHSIINSLSAAAPVLQRQHSATIWQFQYFSSSHRRQRCVSFQQPQLRMHRQQQRLRAASATISLSDRTAARQRYVTAVQQQHLLQHLRHLQHP
jgi:hypothetical protein